MEWWAVREGMTPPFSDVIVFPNQFRSTSTGRPGSLASFWMVKVEGRLSIDGPSESEFSTEGVSDPSQAFTLLPSECPLVE